MDVMPQPLSERGARLLMAHLESFDPQANSARERLQEQLGNELTRKLLFALVSRRPIRRAA